MKRLLPLCLCIILCCGCISESSSESSELISRTEYVLGTVVTIKLLENGSEEILDLAFDRLEEIDALMSVSVESSDISILNREYQAVVSDDTLHVIKAGIDFGHLSKGKFDITLGPVIDLWKIGTEERNIPDSTELNKKLAYVDYKKIEIHDNHLIRIPELSSIDLGGIAKGYAADQVGQLLVDIGVTKAIINLGGNIKVIGSKAKDTPFNIGIQSPDELRNDYLGIIEATDRTIVTSGDYERYFIENGIRYHHIFDAKTGYPYSTDVAAVTVITENSMNADALSTILFMMTINDGLELIQSLPDVECIYITKNLNLYFSSDELKNQFTLTNFDYTIQ